jgi:hypothetical protein
MLLDIVVVDHLGMSNASHEDGDLTGDGMVDSADLDFIFAQFGLELAVSI